MKFTTHISNILNTSVEQYFILCLFLSLKITAHKTSPNQFKKTFKTYQNTHIYFKIHNISLVSIDIRPKFSQKSIMTRSFFRIQPLNSTTTIRENHHKSQHKTERIQQNTKHSGQYVYFHV